MTDSSPNVVAGMTVTANAPKVVGVPTFKPQISVILKKTIQRSTVDGQVGVAQRFSGANQTLDLTPYLGDGSTVVVSKSVREPAGLFSVTLTDQIVPGLLDSIYGQVEPMDCITISMARDASIYAGQGLPILMRGFVSDVRRTMTMGQNGPQRSVVITGQDYGKILSIIYPVYLVGVDPGADLITTFGLFTNYGVSANSQITPKQFIQSIMDNVVNSGSVKTGFIKALQGQSAISPIIYIQTDLQATNDVVSPTGTNGWRGGSVFDLLKAFCDVGPWFELYVEDRSDGPYLVYRPTPFKDLSGNYIQTMEKEPPRHTVPDSQIVGLDLSRSDQNIANYYNISAARMGLFDPSLMQAAAVYSGSDGPFVSNYGNCDPTLYGTRVMNADTEMGANPGGLPLTQYQTVVQNGLDIVAERRQVLIANNRDNAVLESGSATVRGNERIKAGDYVRLKRGQGGLLSDYYCPAVTHQFAVMRSYQTILTLERGMGFVNRLENSSSPYLAELNLGGVYND